MKVGKLGIVWEEAVNGDDAKVWLEFICGAVTDVAQHLSHKSGDDLRNLPDLPVASIELQSPH